MLKKLSLLCGAALAACSLQAQVNILLSAGYLLTSTGSLVPDGALVQLIVSNGNPGAPTLTSFAPTGTVVVASVSVNGATNLGAPGVIDESINFTAPLAFSPGATLSIRWWPTLTVGATQPTFGATYGQLVGLTNVTNTDLPWALPSPGSSIQIRALTPGAFSDFGFTDGTPNITDTQALASFSVIPEPSTAAVGIGAVALLVAVAGRRRSS